jgi:mRNA interferase MazF
LTTNVVEDAEPLRVRVPALAGLRRESDLLIDQLHAIDNRRLVRGPIVHLPEGLMQRVGQALLEVLDLAER